MQAQATLQAGSPSQSIEEDEDDSMPVASTSGNNSFLERSRYIPLRLQSDERRLLRLLEAALSVSEYTDKVDIINWKSKTARIHAQIKDICAILSGLVVAQNYKKGQQLVQVWAKVALDQLLIGYSPHPSGVLAFLCQDVQVLSRCIVCIVSSQIAHDQTSRSIRLTDITHLDLLSNVCVFVILASAVIVHCTNHHT